MINLVFPVAGRGSRFGNKFKPFLRVADKHFIEIAYGPFKKWSDAIDSVIFIFTKEQEEKFAVEKKLKDLIGHPNVITIQIPEQTKGPCETIATALPQMPSGSYIICDCDHTLNVDPIFEEIFGWNVTSDDIDCIIPTWDFDRSESSDWSKVIHSNGSIKMICEKESVKTQDFDISGIIGCTYFKDSSYFSDGVHISDWLTTMLSSGCDIRMVAIDEANFYGDPRRLKEYKDILRNRMSIFCDIDGTLLKHKDHTDCDTSDNTALDGSELLLKWKNEGHRILLTTSRREDTRKELCSLLSDLNIHYDDLIMGLPSGPRIVINDRKPSRPFTTQSHGIEVTRDEGLSRVNLIDIQHETSLERLKNLSGNSFADLYVLKRTDGHKLVRKQIIKNNNNNIHYLKLKKQVDSLRRFDCLWPESTPKIFNTHDSSLEYYYDMEYLENYTTLSEDANASRTITSLLQDMTKYIYHSRTKIGGQQWLQKHIDEKILPNLNDHSITHDIDKIINSDVVTINKKQYFGIKKSLEGIDKLGVEPAFLTPIHGDLTFENILVNDHGSIKLIDMDGSDVLDAPELDLGKLCQSALASYETWRTANLAVQVDGSNYICDDKYWQIRFDIDTTQSIINSGCSILNTTPSQVWTKCIFYMSLHFIRLAPFARKISEEHYTYAFLMACVWLSNLRERQFCYA